MHPAEVKRLLSSLVRALVGCWRRKSVARFLMTLMRPVLARFSLHAVGFMFSHWGGFSGALNGVCGALGRMFVWSPVNLRGLSEMCVCLQTCCCPGHFYRAPGACGSSTLRVGSPADQRERRWSSLEQGKGAATTPPSSEETLGSGHPAPQEQDAQALPFVWNALISELAHELNSPLSSLKGMLEVFSDHPGLGYSDRENLQMMCKAAENMEKITSRAQTSRVGRSAQPVASSSLFDVNELLLKELERFRNRCSALGVQVFHSRSSGGALCYGQPELLHEAIGRVICNSLDAFAAQDRSSSDSLQHGESASGTGRGSTLETRRDFLHKERWLRLTVDCDAFHGFVRIVHQDNAGGMSPETLQECVHPFFSTRPHSLGLGLVIARSAVERLGGQFEIQSAEGAGTTLCFTLRLVPESLCSSGWLRDTFGSPSSSVGFSSGKSQSTSCVPFNQGCCGHQPHRVQLGGLGKRHLVVVDDDETVIALLKVYLSGAFKLTCCGSASLALSSVRSLGCDAVLTDLRMPVVSGLELSVQIRSLCPQLPVIVMSGNCDEARTLFESGAFAGLIEKPFANRAHLVERLNQLLAHDRQMIGDGRAF